MFPILAFSLKSDRTARCFIKTNSPMIGSWNPRTTFQVGDKVEAYVLRLEPARHHIYLTLRKISPHPWQQIKVGKVYSGTITCLTGYGAYVELECGLQGLVHSSELTWTRYFVQPSDLVELEQSIDVLILKIERDRNRIEMSIRRVTENPWPMIAEKYAAGTQVTGKSRRFRPPQRVCGNRTGHPRSPAC